MVSEPGVKPAFSEPSERQPALVVGQQQPQSQGATTHGQAGTNSGNAFADYPSGCKHSRGVDSGSKLLKTSDRRGRVDLRSKEALEVRDRGQLMDKEKRYSDPLAGSCISDPVIISFLKPEDRGGEEESVNKMSRSNTICVISDENEALEDLRQRRNLTNEKPLTDTRRRKQHNIDAALSQRLSSSLQFIDRQQQGDSLYISHENREGDMLEQKPVATPKVFALESSSLGFTCCDWLPNQISVHNHKLLKRIEYLIGVEPIQFLKARENFKTMTGFPGALFSDFTFRYSTPYFTQSTEVIHSTSHLVVCVHGLDGNSADLRLVKTYLEIALPSANLDFLMSEINQMDTFLSLEEMTDKLVNEISYHISNFKKTVTRISFIGHSLGCILIRSAILRPELAKYSSKFYTFLSLSGPHLGTLYNNSGLVNAGLWMIQKWKKTGSIQQLTMKDSGDIRTTFLYKLAQKSNLHRFKHVLLAGMFLFMFIFYT